MKCLFSLCFLVVLSSFLAFGPFSSALLLLIHFLFQCSRVPLSLPHAVHLGHHLMLRTPFPLAYLMTSFWLHVGILIPSLSVQLKIYFKKAILRQFEVLDDYRRKDF